MEMRIEYENTLEDMVAFNLFHYRDSPSLRRTATTQLFIIPLFFALLPISSILAGDDWPAMLFMVVIWTAVTLGWVLLFPRYARWSIRRRAASLYREGENKGTIGEHVIALTPEGLTDSTDVRKTTVKWAGVNKIATDDRYIYVYISSTSAFIIPKRAFADETSAKSFMETAERLRNAHTA